MSATFSVAINQIQLTSWLDEPPSPFSWNETRRATRSERRAELLKTLCTVGSPMSYADLSEYTGWSKQTITGLAANLIDTGAVRRVVINSTIHLEATTS